MTMGGMLMCWYIHQGTMRSIVVPVFAIMLNGSILMRVL